MTNRMDDLFQRGEGIATRVELLAEFYLAVHALWEANAAFDALAVNGMYPEEPTKLNAALQVIRDAKARVEAADKVVKGETK